MAQKFRKRPVVVEAIRWTGQPVEEVAEFCPDVGAHYESLLIPTLEGMMVACMDDWIIKGIAGEFYPCKPNIFDLTYDQLDDGQHT